MAGQGTARLGKARQGKLKTKGPVISGASKGAKMKRLICIALVGLLLGAALLYAQSVYDIKCPYCSGYSYFTGRTRIDESGTLLYEYQCRKYLKHKFWVRKEARVP